MVMATILRANGRQEIQWFGEFGLIQKVGEAIGAAITKRIDLRDGRILFVDDNGHALKKLHNREATLLYYSVCRPNTTHHIVGDAAILRERDCHVKNG